ncbi:MAG: Helix-turn-helix domain [Herbinix sp.]|jgi:transcriptional regulator with XRE-family HTH domain|nr:Helix-turn-helix domain [Herbinix sp.]
MIDGKEFGQRIRSARQRKNIKQLALCELADISQPRLSAMENGDTNMLINSLDKIAETLEVPVSWLLGEDVISVNGLTTDEILELLKYKELLIRKRK